MSKNENTQIIDVYSVLPTVLFTEDDWNTTYEGCVIKAIFTHIR